MKLVYSIIGGTYEKISRDEIIDNWNKYKSVKRMAKELNISWNRIIKELSSNGIIINDNHRCIIRLYNQGNSIEEIANHLNISCNTVKSYLPRIKGRYGDENCSIKAKLIRDWRNKKENENREQIEN